MTTQPTPNTTDETEIQELKAELTEERRANRRLRIKAWLAVPASVTRGWLLLSVAIGFVFLGCAIYAAVQTVKLDNRVTQQQIAESVASQVTTCVTTNERRAEAKQVADESLAADQSSLDRDLEALHNDEANWEAIDGLFEGGIPEPARATIFAGLAVRANTLTSQQKALDSRQSRINSAYEPVDCKLIATANIVEATDL